MSLLNFVIFFFLFLLLAALIISGFYIITRGEKSIEPDGSVRIKGKIFKCWSLFWERTTGTKRVYYSGKELTTAYDLLREYNFRLAASMKVAEGEKSLEFQGQLSADDLYYIRELLHCDIEISSAPYLFFYREDPIYYWPEWLRFPLSQCPPCMASVGGTLLYWPVIIFAGNVFSWSGYSPFLLYVYFWILFCLALSALNKLAYNIIGM